MQRSVGAVVIAAFAHRLDLPTDSYGRISYPARANAVNGLCSSATPSCRFIASSDCLPDQSSREIGRPNGPGSSIAFLAARVSISRLLAARTSI